MSDAVEATQPPPASAPPGTSTAPARGGGEQFGATGLLPSASSREDHGAPSPVVAVEERQPSRLRGTATAREGTALSCQDRNARGRIHQDGVCIVCRDFGGAR